MFCPNCGKKNPDDSRFCEGCGTNLSEQAAPVTSSAPAAPPVYAQPAYTPPVQPAYQAVPQQTYYQQPAYPAADLNKPMSVGAYIGTMLVLCIPLVNFIMLLVWAFGSSTNLNRRNLCRAMIILGLIGAAIGIVMSIAFASFLPSLLESLEYSF